MAPPRFAQGWTDAQNPPPPGATTLTPFSLVFCRVGGAGNWTVVPLGLLQPADVCLVLGTGPGGAWGPAALPAAGVVLAIPSPAPPP